MIGGRQRCFFELHGFINTERPPVQVHASKVNGAVVNLRAKGDKLGVSLLSNSSKLRMASKLDKIKKNILAVYFIF